MGRRIAKADVVPVRQQNQYNCVTTSLAMALRALGVPEDECSPARVNKVVGAMPLQGAAWEPMLAAANHYGMRATLTLPSTVRQLKSWTDAGKPVVIAWNPEGREWSHASLVFDVDDDLNVYVADPNIPDPDETVRVVPKGDFYSKWYEKAPQGFLIRRPACVIEREITPDGRQVMASRKKTAGVDSWQRGLGNTSMKEVKGEGGRPLGWISVDRGKVNWRPNQLVDGLPRPQVIAREHYSTPIQELESLADSWLSRNVGATLMAKRVASRFGLYVVDKKKGVVLQGAPDRGLGEEDLWIWIDEVSEESQRHIHGRGQDPRKTLTVMTAKAVLDKWGKIKWAPKRRQDPMGLTADAGSARRVMMRFAGKRLDQGVRREINQALIRAGMDGNGRFRSAQQGYSRAVDVLQDEGIELDEVVSSHLFNQPSGTIKADIAYTNYGDLFSPVSISNSILYLQYTELRPDVFEVVAYLS